MRPAAHSLSFASPKESKQRKGDPAVCDPYAALRGNLGCSFAGCAAELAARCALRSNSCGKPVLDAGVSCGTPATPRPARPRRIQKGWSRAIAALGPEGRARSASSPPGRAKQRPAAHLPIWLRLWRGACGVACVPQDTHASTSGSPWLSECSAQRVASSTAHPANSPTQVAP